MRPDSEPMVEEGWIGTRGEVRMFSGQCIRGINSKTGRGHAAHVEGPQHRGHPAVLCVDRGAVAVCRSKRRQAVARGTLPLTCNTSGHPNSNCAENHEGA